MSSVQWPKFCLNLSVLNISLLWRFFLRQFMKISTMVTWRCRCVSITCAITSMTSSPVISCPWPSNDLWWRRCSRASGSCTNMASYMEDCLWVTTLLYSPGLMASGMSVGIEARPVIGLCHHLFDWLISITQKIKSSNGRLWGCQTGAKSEHPKVVQNSSFKWVVEWLL